MKASLREIDLEPPEVELPKLMQNVDKHQNDQPKGPSDGKVRENADAKMNRGTFIAPSSVPDSFCDNDSCAI